MTKEKHRFIVLDAWGHREVGYVEREGRLGVPGTVYRGYRQVSGPPEHTVELVAECPQLQLAAQRVRQEPRR
jgi:hypothetical protein